MTTTRIRRRLLRMAITSLAAASGIAGAGIADAAGTTVYVADTGYTTCPAAGTYQLVTGAAPAGAQVFVATRAASGAGNCLIDRGSFDVAPQSATSPTGGSLYKLSGSTASGDTYLRF